MCRLHTLPELRLSALSSSLFSQDTSTDADNGEVMYLSELLGENLPIKKLPLLL
jgi:hypothetical protein